MSIAGFLSLFEWLSAHPIVAGLLVFVIALSESLAIIGLIIPGIFFMVVFGALITTGYLDFAPTVVAAILGAISGDGISYWLGRRYHQQLYQLWPLRNRPGLLERGEAFFHRHGGMSVLLGRFVGPLRPIIPAIAGMLAMPRQRFIATNVASALLWGPLVLLPGMAFGLSLEIAAEFAGRLSVLLIILFLLLWLTFWIIKRLYFFFVPRTDQLFSHVINWVNRHPLIGRVPAALIDPRHPEMRVLTLLGLMLILATVTLTALSQFLGQYSLLRGLNELLFYQLQQLHNPPFDHSMLYLSRLGDDLFLAALTLVLFLWTALYRNWLAGWHLLAAFLLPLLVVHTLQLLFDIPPPDITASHSNQMFPAGHITLATAVYGFIAVVLTRDMPAVLRSIVYISLSLVVLLIGFARLYLGVHWLSDVVGGILLGLVWVGLLGIGYRRHVHMPALPLKKLGHPVLVIVGLLIAYPISQGSKGLPSVPTPSQSYRISLPGWQQSGWQTLQQYRSSLFQRREFPLNLQWRASRQYIESTLKQAGWEQTSFSAGNLTGWLRPSAGLKELGVIPHLHEGRYEQIRYMHYQEKQNRILTLRLWQSTLYVEDKQGIEKPLWVGEVSYLQRITVGPFQYLKTMDNFERALSELKRKTGPASIVAQTHAGPYRVLLLGSESETEQHTGE